MKQLVFGHKNPDTDSTCSALVFQLGEQQKGRNIEAVLLGKINKETEYVLETLNIDMPRIIDNVENGQEIIMVDHNEFTQSVDNIENAKILEVYDHHRLKNFETNEPLKIDMQPVGCTSTILYLKYSQDKEVEITEQMAKLMLSAIISDSLLFKSPTCTDLDKEVAYKLSEIANVNIEEYGMKVLKAGTNLDDLSAIELLDVDTKEFKNENTKYEIGQVNTVDIEEFQKIRKEDLTKAIEERIQNKQLDAFLLIVTDILNSNSIAYLLGNTAPEIAQKLNKTITDNIIELPGVVSRKKQVVPFL